MGKEITSVHFTKEDTKQFHLTLAKETAHLLEKLREKRKTCPKESAETMGLELESWLVDMDFLPAPKNKEFLTKLNNPLAVTEISKYNFELNADPVLCHSDCFSKTHKALNRLWTQADTCANQIGLNCLMIGSVPTLRDQMLQQEFLSESKRYKALSDQIMRLRKGKPLELDIQGKDHLKVTHKDIMLESAATSLQIHYQPSFDKFEKFFNSSKLITPVMIAACANSPYLFGAELWEESRIAIFERGVHVPSYKLEDGTWEKRVTFGHQYLHNNVEEIFIENLEKYSVLLPSCLDTPVEKLNHLSLHNGNIWRWNRPVLSVDKNDDVHVRLEHRSPSAGPTVADVVSNMCFFIGLLNYVVHEVDFERFPAYSKLQEGFYEAAKRGLNAEVQWLDNKKVRLQDLILNDLIPKAKKGLELIQIDKYEIDHYLMNVIKNRVRTGRTGSSWQKSWVATHGPDFQEMTRAYHLLQREGMPVHEWPV